MGYFEVRETWMDTFGPLSDKDFDHIYKSESLVKVHRKKMITSKG